MSRNNHLIMRIILGAVLAFQGAKLLGALLQDKPDNYILMGAIAIAFIAIGVIFAVNSIKEYIKLSKESGIDVVSYEDLKREEAESKAVLENKEGEDKSCE